MINNIAGYYINELLWYILEMTVLVYAFFTLTALFTAVMQFIIKVIRDK